MVDRVNPVQVRNGRLPVGIRIKGLGGVLAAYLHRPVVGGRRRRRICWRCLGRGFDHAIQLLLLLRSDLLALPVHLVIAACRGAGHHADEKALVVHLLGKGDSVGFGKAEGDQRADEHTRKPRQPRGAQRPGEGYP
jgi:hypothetical protein